MRSALHAPQFDRHLLLLPERADVCRTEFEFNAAVRYRATASLARPRTWQGERLLRCNVQPACSQTRIGIARSSAQSMIQVANDQSFVTRG
jgi:hypothetical protein